MSYELEPSHQAASYYRRLDARAEPRIRQRLADIQRDPYDPRLTKPLTNAAGGRSARVGGWRIVYTVDEARHLVSVSDIGPRGDVCRGL